MTEKQGSSPESIVREIKRQTRREFTAEEKIRIVLEGLRGEAGITDLCRKEGIHPTMYYKWSKAFLEAGKRQLNGDTIREAGSDEVKELRTENDSLKMVVAELTLRNRTLKKPCRVWKPNPSIHEVHAVREDGDHPDGRGVLVERQADAERDGCSPQFLLRVVQKIQGRRL
jgi:transposase